ncbi:hypothetical protein [Piscinibacter terrae]|nr:hypothetical protein [Albitalea terrae]
MAVKPAGPEPGTFDEALRATPAGTRLGDAGGVVRALKEMGQPQQAEALRRELLTLYIRKLDGTPPEAGLTLGQLIDRGLKRPSSDPELAAAWQRAYQRSVAFEWDDLQSPLPPGLMPYKNQIEPGWLVRSGPGVWTMHGSWETLYLALRLKNTTDEALPLFDMTLSLAGGGSMPALQCSPDPRPADSAWVGQWRLPAGGSKALLCKTEGIAPKALGALPERLSVLVDAARLGGPQPTLVLPDFAQPQVQARLEGALSAARLSDPGEAWLRAWKQVQERPSWRWQASTQAMHAPNLVPPPPTLWERVLALFAPMKFALMCTVGALLVFALVRAMDHLGAPDLVSGLVGIALLAGITMLITGRVHLDSSAQGVVEALSVSFVFGSMAIGVLLLLALHRFLDQEEVSWTQTVVLGWARMLDWRGESGRAEFWGFLAHAAWIWTMANAFFGGLKWLVLALLLPPAAALVLRRLRAIPLSDVLVGSAVVLLWVITLKT